MEKAEVYKDCRGEWKIGFLFQGAMRVLTIKEAKELKEVLEAGILFAEQDEEYVLTEKGKAVAEALKK